MPLSEIWTIQAASGGPEKTLAEWGFVSASRSSAVQAEDVVSLTSAVADAVAVADLWAWETELILRRDGEVYYRGFVDSPRRVLTPDGESIVLDLRSLWWLLRMTYRQTWTALTGASTEQVHTTRVRLGHTESGNTVAAMFGELSTYAATMGVTVAFNLSELPAQKIPPVEGHNRPITDLIRDIMRWFPNASLVPVYSESGTTYRARLSSSTPVQVFAIGDQPLADLDIAALHERRVDAVQVIYETIADEASYDDSTAEGEGGFSATPRLVAATDTYPVGATITRRSLVITLPHPSPPTGGGGTPGDQPTRHEQPIVSKKWPVDGSTGTTAQQWWLDRSSLGTMGLTVEDILLPSSSDETTLAHRVTIDPADIPNPPSAVNPNSTPVWKPATASATPRELMSGGLSDWMPGRIKAYSLIAEATIAVKKSAVDALTDANKAAFLRLNRRNKVISGHAAYLLDGLYKFMGTNALTKVYSKEVATNQAGVGSSAGAGEANGTSYADAVELAVIPNLAQRLFEALSPLHYKGSVPLTFEEPPVTSFLGRRIALDHAERPEWLSMAAQVSQETVDIATGRVNLTFGPPAHLGAADWKDLHAAARVTHARRTESAAAPQPVGNPAPDEESEDDPPRTASFGASITPIKSFNWQSGGIEPRLWDIVPDTGAASKLFAPEVLWKRSDVTTSVSISGNSFTLSADKWLVATITNLSTPTITIELIAGSWGDYPSAYEFDGSNDFVAARIPLWHFTGSETDGAVSVGENIWGRKKVASDVLRLVFPLYAIPSTTALRSVPDLL